MTWLNWSLKLHSRLRTIPHLTHTQHTCLMVNECLIFLFDCICLNVMCVCSSLYGSNQKDFWSFYMYLEVIFITFCVHIICLLCFSLFKHVLCWKNKCQKFWLLILVTCKLRDSITSLHIMVLRLTRDSPVTNCPEIAF